MKSKAFNFSIAGSIIMLVFSVFMVLISPVLHDMTPINLHIQAKENLETIIICIGGLVVSGLGLSGGLFLNRNVKASQILLICSAGLCIAYTLYTYFLIEQSIFLLMFSIPFVLLAISAIMSFLLKKAHNRNNQI